MRAAIWTVSVLVPFAAACGDAGDDYRVTLDLGSTIRALVSDDLDQSSDATDRILAQGAAALPALRTALRKEPPDVRREVVSVATRIDDPAAVQLLVDAARDGDAGVRYEALNGLGARAVAETRGTVESALTDEDPRARMAAAAACRPLCASPAAMARLVEIAVHDQPLSNATAARTAIIAILKDRDRAGPLQAAIRAAIPPVLAARAAGDAPIRAALIASDVGDPSGRDVLAVAARGDGVPPALRLQAIHALGTIGDAGSVGVLAAIEGQATFLEYACDAVRRIAARGIEPAREALERWSGKCPAAALPPPPGAR